MNGLKGRFHELWATTMLTVFTLGRTSKVKLHKMTDFVGHLTSHDVIMFVICDFTICTESQKEHELGVKYQDVILECKNTSDAMLPKNAVKN